MFSPLFAVQNIVWTTIFPIDFQNRGISEKEKTFLNGCLPQNCSQTSFSKFHLPKRGFGPPSSGTFSTHLRCHYSVSPVQQSTIEWRGPEIFSKVRSLVRFPPPIRFAPPPLSWPRSCRLNSLFWSEGPDNDITRNRLPFRNYIDGLGILLPRAVTERNMFGIILQ